MARNGEEHYQEYQQHLAAGHLQNAGLSLMTAAICGYMPAQAELGYKYLNGILFPKDYDQAMRWLSAAADQKDPESLTNLATMYMYGYGTRTDGEKARDLLNEAWGLGYTPAARFLGLCREKGLGGPKNQEEAADWYRQGAEAGDDGAAFLLGDCYENGSGVKRDIPEARHWYEKAAEGEGEVAKTAREALSRLREP